MIDSKDKLQEALKAAGVSLVRNQVTNDDVLVNSNGVRHRDSEISNITVAVSAADVDQVMADIAAKYKNLTQDQLGAIKTKLQGAVRTGATKLGELMAQADQAASGYAEQNSQQQNLTPQQETQKLWTDFNACEKEIQNEFEQLYKDGKISYEQMQYLRTERGRLDALPEDSDKRIAGEMKFAAYQKELGVHVRDEARNNDDQVTAQAADVVVGQANAQTKRLGELHKLYVEGKKEQVQPAQAKASMHMSDDGESPTAVNMSREKQGMEVVDATLNDIQAPTGAKERSSGKTTVKA